jgi:hypothetical protein
MSDEPTGDCYEAAGRYMQNATIAGEADNLTLVHGVVSGQGPLEGRRIDHAWIEVEERAPGFPISIWLVVDRSMGRNLVLPREVYYRAGQIELDECRRYTPEEAMIEMVRSQHWGPWEGESSDD